MCWDHMNEKNEIRHGNLFGPLCEVDCHTLIDHHYRLFIICDFIIIHIIIIINIFVISISYGIITALVVVFENLTFDFCSYWSFPFR